MFAENYSQKQSSETQKGNFTSSSRILCIDLLSPSKVQLVFVAAKNNNIQKSIGLFQLNVILVLLVSLLAASFPIPEIYFPKNPTLFLSILICCFATLKLFLNFQSEFLRKQAKLSFCFDILLNAVFIYCVEWTVFACHVGAYIDLCRQARTLAGGVFTSLILLQCFLSVGIQPTVLSLGLLTSVMVFAGFVSLSLSCLWLGMRKVDPVYFFFEGLSLALVNTYLVVDTYFILKFRNNGLSKNAVVQRYFSLQMDWLAYFWVDCLRNCRQGRRISDKKDTKIVAENVFAENKTDPSESAEEFNTSFDCEMSKSAIY